MRKVMLVLVITGFAVVFFLSIKSQIADLFAGPDLPQVELPEEQLIIVPEINISVRQGGSTAIFTLENKLNKNVTYRLVHNHDFLIIEPHLDKLVPEGQREVIVIAEPNCPTGEITLPVYLRAESNGTRFGLETTVIMDLLPAQ